MAVITWPTGTQLLVTREFDAPSHLVYRAWNEPDLRRLWWGAGWGEATISERDLRVGGSWRNVVTHRSGLQIGWHGEFREIIPNERVVATVISEADPGLTGTSVITFTDKGERCTVTAFSEHSRKRVRAPAIAHLEAAQISWDRLEEVARSLR
ncbi:MAG: SRPBCC domain-containing protein [Chloroflexota bacterium]